MWSEIPRKFFREIAVTHWRWKQGGLGTNVRRGDGQIPLGCILDDVTNEERFAGMEWDGGFCKVNLFLLVSSFTQCLVH